MNVLKRTAFLSSRLLINVRHTGTNLYEPDYLKVQNDVYNTSIILPFSDNEIESAPLRHT